MKVRILRHGSARYRAQGVIGPACWKVYDLIVFQEGNFTFRLPQNGLTLSAGDAVLITPGTFFHATADKNGGRIWVAHFSPGRSQELKWLRDPKASPFRIFASGAISPWCQALLDRISATYPTGGAPDECHRLLPLLLEALHQATPTGSSPIRSALQQAEELDWKGVTLEKLATWSGYSPSHFRSVFERETGITVGRYLRQRRLEMARRLLQEQSLPIKQISDLLGYSSPSSFHHAFQSTHGCTPAGFRERTGVRH